MKLPWLSTVTLFILQTANANNKRGLVRGAVTKPIQPFSGWSAEEKTWGDLSKAD